MLMGLVEQRGLKQEVGQTYSGLFGCLFQPLSSTKTDRGAQKYPLKWQWRE